ncbi:hypothetical protein JOC37_002192 [Desulfohalotomaculum tongense]|uniref:SHOCT-like domain-containing protein n=1 Tax=Desulforadius tongensis TaxID=1216062 RepID=UPI001957062B|nr:hypothetical protein [Desulforadius tongensis]MBM7855777.1 hypothetical protein [Desulforadius tongensis]
MSNEKAKILEMIQEGKISAAEGLELLKALEKLEVKQEKTTPPAGKILRVRVDGNNTKKVNLNLPLNVIKAASKFAWMGINLIPENIRTELEKKGIDLAKINFEELAQLIEQGLVQEKLVDIDINDSKEGKLKVEVYIE